MAQACTSVLSANTLWPKSGRWALHTTAHQAGEVARTAGVQCLVLAHLIRQDHDWLFGIMDEATKEYEGKLYVARKGLQISALGTRAQVAHSL